MNCKRKSTPHYKCQIDKSKCHLPWGGDCYKIGEVKKTASADELLADARALIDGAYDIVEIWSVRGSPYNKEWKRKWLKQAREVHGAIPSL